MKLIIAGGRDYHLKKKDISRLLKLHSLIEITEVVSGRARGVDRDGEVFAKHMQIPIRYFPANWKKFKKRAGHFRNEEMANYADSVSLFPGNKGTESMYKFAKKKGIKIYDWR